MAAWYEIIESIRDYMRNFGAVTIKAEVTAGATSATFLNTTLTYNLKEGNTFAVAGDSQVYTLTADATNTLVTESVVSKTGKSMIKLTNENAIGFSPPAKTTWAADAVVTFGEDVIETQIDAGAAVISDTTLTNGALMIVRKDEPKKTTYNGSEGSATLLLEAWARDDSPDLMLGYKKLSEFESKIEEILIKWHLDGTLAFVTYMEISDSAGDGESYRPNIGSQTIVTVKWSKRII